MPDDEPAAPPFVVDGVLARDGDELVDDDDVDNVSEEADPSGAKDRLLPLWDVVPAPDGPKLLEGLLVTPGPKRGRDGVSARGPVRWASSPN